MLAGGERGFNGPSLVCDGRIRRSLSAVVVIGVHQKENEHDPLFIEIRRRSHVAVGFRRRLRR